MADEKRRVVADNRRARFNYEIGQVFEAGITLVGTEVKALREGRANIADSYAGETGGEMWLYNAYIPEYLQANRFNHEEKRPRKLLVSRKDLAKLSEGVERAGNTIVPLKLYFNDRGIAKLLIGLAKGKKSFDKRETERKRDWNREKGRILKEGGRG
jgi:SsrA-binding protein